MQIEWTPYSLHRLSTRDYDIAKAEEIIRYSSERYYDSDTGRLVVVGRIDETLVIIAYEQVEGTIIPITIHGTTRQKVNFRLRTGRLLSE